MSNYSANYGKMLYGPSDLLPLLPNLRFYIGDIVPAHAINLAYVHSPAPTADDVIRVINELDVSLEHVSNYDTYVRTDASGTASPVVGYSDYCMMTDKFYQEFTTEDFNSLSGKHKILSSALFYRYHLRSYCIDRPGLPVGHVEQSSVSIVSPLGEVLKDKYMLWKVYIEKVIDSSKGIYDCVVWTNFNKRGYTVVYTPPTGRMDHSETFNPMPLLFQGSSTIKLTYTATKYGNKYRIVSNYKFQPNGVVAVKFPTDHYFNVDMPTYISRDNNWYIKIGRGHFAVGANSYTNHLYYGQNFMANMMPALRITNDPCRIISPTKVQVSHRPILSGFYDRNALGISIDYEFPLTIKVNNISYSTKPTSAEDFSGVLDYDAYAGTVTLPFELQEGDKVTADYFIWELYYEYRGYKNSNDIYMHLDVNPNSGHYTVFDYQEGSYEESHNLVGRPISLWLNVNGINGTEPEVNMYHTFSDSPSTTYAPYSPGKTLQLAFVNISDYNYEPIVLDARSRGGGLRDNVNPDTNGEQYWDIGYWEGKPYQSNGVFVVDINNKNFTKAHINSIIEQYKAAGTLGLLTSRTGK